MTSERLSPISFSWTPPYPHGDLSVGDYGTLVGAQERTRSTRSFDPRACVTFILFFSGINIFNLFIYWSITYDVILALGVQLVGSTVL